MRFDLTYFTKRTIVITHSVTGTVSGTLQYLTEQNLLLTVNNLYTMVKKKISGCIYDIF